MIKYVLNRGNVLGLDKVREYYEVDIALEGYEFIINFGYVFKEFRLADIMKVM